MSAISIKQLLEAGVHFGHQTHRWNPKMRDYIFGERNGIYIIDLQQTLKLFKEAVEFVSDLASRGQSVLFVGTKRQAQEAVQEEAERCGMYYVNNRWLGGLLTNFQTIQNSIKRYKELDAQRSEGFYSKLSKKEAARIERERKKLEKNLKGIREMDRLPGAVFVIDANREAIAVAEAARLKIPVIAIVDTNCDPDHVDFVIPGNDDALRAIRLFTATIADAVRAGRSVYDAKVEEELREAKEKQAREAAKRKAEAEAKKAEREAREKARAEAEAKKKEAAEAESKKKDAKAAAGEAPEEGEAPQKAPAEAKKAAPKKAVPKKATPKKEATKKEAPAEQEAAPEKAAPKAETEVSEEAAETEAPKAKPAKKAAAKEASSQESPAQEEKAPEDAEAPAEAKKTAKKTRPKASAKKAKTAKKAETAKAKTAAVEAQDATSADEPETADASETSSDEPDSAVEAQT